MLSVFISQLMHIQNAPNSGKSSGDYGVRIPPAISCSVVALVVTLLGAYCYLT